MIYDTEGQVQIVLSAILSVNKIMYSVKFVYSFKNCHHIAIWLCVNITYATPLDPGTVFVLLMVEKWYIDGMASSDLMLTSGFMRFIWFNNTADTCINMIAC